MATVAENQKTIGWEEYLSLPLTHYGIIDGEVKELPLPSVKHQRVSGKLFRHLLEQGEETGYGILLNSPLDVLIRRNFLCTRQPDVLFISKERCGVEETLISQDRIEVAPDLVVEILSPSDMATASRGKCPDCDRLGVRELWAVDPQDASIEVLLNEKGHWLSQGIIPGTSPSIQRFCPIEN